MTVSIMQPAYLPWPGYFDRVRRSDLHVVLDHVSMDENSRTKFANRNRIRTPQGWTWLTVPVRSKGLHGKLVIREIEISGDGGWQAKHWGALRANYARAPHFEDDQPWLEEIYAGSWSRLCDLNQAVTARMLEAFGIRVKTLSSSAMGVAGAGHELILNLCLAAGATRYLSGPFGREYLDAEAFARAGIEVLVHTYSTAAYPQCFPGWEPNLSAVDMLWNLGREEASSRLEADGHLEPL
ncbi:MAG: WbqC family protein [Terrimicrobiaceae bacterium]|nr:WbqC family protein [Terrimicrobiaceae bacterium]